MKAGDICKRDVIVTRPDAAVVEAATLMRTHHVGDLVIVRDGGGEPVPIGILTDRDIALCVDRLIQRPQMKVADVMSVELVTAAEHDELHDVLKKMQVGGIRRMPVVDRRGILAGILTLDDVIELLSEELTDLVKLVAAEQRRERVQRTAASAS